MLSVKNITKKYKNGDSYIHAVDQLSLNFEIGEFAFVLGASGSGKSTLLNILCGIDTEIDGNVVIDGLDTSSFSKKDWAVYRNHYVGFIFQEYNLIEHLKVWENVALPLQFQGISKQEAKEKAIAELEQVGLGKFVNKYPNQISGGQAQRVAIARALVTNPKVIMADEPTGALDTELGDKIIGYLKKVSKERVVIVVTHDEELAEKYASRIVRLSDGKVIDDSNPIDQVPSTTNEVDFVQPKMKFSMMAKFAKNNVVSRMFRSLATSSVVSIGYISILLLTFLIFGINSSIASTISKFLPEDQYVVYPIENAEISETQMNDIRQSSIVEHVEYNIVASASFISNTGSRNRFTMTSVPYDMAYLTQNAELFGRVPEDDNEILINIGTAAGMRSISNVDDDSYEYIYNLVKGQMISIEHYDYDSFGSELSIGIGEYEIVGVIASEMMMYEPIGYVVSSEMETVYQTVYQTDDYKNVAVLYFNTTNEDKIEDFVVDLRDDEDLVVENFYSSITSGVEDFMYRALKIFVGIASVSLIVSGILIGLVIYTSILERVKEIGILTAIGAKQSNILGIFLMESAMIGFLSSLIATGVGLVITRIINGLFSSFIETPLQMLSSGFFEMTLLTPKISIILAVVGFSILYSVLAGLIPSYRATKMNAIKALRRE